MLVVIVDGPGLEHTREAIVPFLVFRMAWSLHLHSSLLATLLFANHLAHIRAKVRRHHEQRSRSLQSILLMRARMSLSASMNACGKSRLSSRVSASVHATPVVAEQRSPMGNSKPVWHKNLGHHGGCTRATIAIPLVLLSVLDLGVACMEGLYIATEAVSTSSMIYICLTALLIGAWFNNVFWQVWQIKKAFMRARSIRASTILSMRTSSLATSLTGWRRASSLTFGRLSSTLAATLPIRARGSMSVSVTGRAPAPVPHPANIYGGTTTTKLYRNATRMGATLFATILLLIVSVGVRMTLVDDGGMVYWWTMLPLWCALHAASLCMCATPVLAIKRPNSRVVGGTARATSISQLSANMRMARSRVRNSVVRRITCASISPHSSSIGHAPSVDAVKALSSSPHEPSARRPSLAMQRMLASGMGASGLRDSMRDSGQSSVGQRTPAGSPAMRHLRASAAA